MSKPIPYNRPYMVGTELERIAEAHRNGILAGNGSFTRQCESWLEAQTGCQSALMVHSCTAALEMAAILADFNPGDEVIMPSFTFVSTANAFVLRGGIPVFVDIRPDTLNLNEDLVEAAITPRTRAIVAVHYAGVGCDMRRLLDIAQRHGLLLIEDAAQGLMSAWRNQPLGGIGDLAAVSFHETKNIISGEGGALLINRPDMVARARVIRDKGTNRDSFFRGEVDKYTWMDIGSSYLPGEVIAAFLSAQMEQAQSITARRIALWQTYHQAFESLENAGLLRRPVIPPDCVHNGHIYYLLLPTPAIRDHLLDHCRRQEVGAVFHYLPLHRAPAGQRYGRASGDLPVTDRVAATLIRLPLFIELSADDQQRVIDTVEQGLKGAPR